MRRYQAFSRRKYTSLWPNDLLQSLLIFANKELAASTTQSKSPNFA
jgi:hypothetical protein